MAITTFVAGDVLTAAQLNGSFTTAGGLQFIKSQVVGTTVSSFTVTNAFSATYDNYLITFNGGVQAGTSDLSLKLGATATGYYQQLNYGLYGATIAGGGASNQAAFQYAGSGDTKISTIFMSVQNPFLTNRTVFNSQISTVQLSAVGGGYLDNATSYTDFTITCVVSTITGGTCRVYGYAKS